MIVELGVDGFYNSAPRFHDVKFTQWILCGWKARVG